LIGFARAKEYLFTGDLMTAAEALSLSLETQSNLSRDHQEAVRAFAAKQRPNFSGE
jgi:enoyl-CoA hydratase/carnithine racemase